MNISREESLKRAYELITALMDETLSGEIRLRIAGWLHNGGSLEEKSSALGRLISELEPNLFPDRYEYEKLAEIHRILGFNDSGDNRGPRRKISLTRIITRAAAVMVPLFIAAGGGYLWYAQMEREAQRRDSLSVVISAEESSKIFILPDGSEVIIGKGSHIEYPLSFGDNRNVSLKGEAMFKVKESLLSDGEKKPFRVNTDDFAVTVLGTDFRIREGESTVSLYEGRLRVEPEGEPTLLSSGERLSYDAETGISTIGMIPVSEMLENGYLPRLKFEDATIRDIIRSVELNCGVTFVIAGDVVLDAGRLSADFEDESIEGIVGLLNLIDSTHTFSRSGDTINMSKK